MGEHADQQRAQWDKIFNILKANGGMMRQDELQKAFGYTRKTLWVRLGEMKDFSDYRKIVAFKDGKIKYVRLVDISQSDPEQRLVEVFENSTDMVEGIIANYENFKPEDRATVLSCLTGWLTFDYYNMHMFMQFAPSDYKQVGAEAIDKFRELTRMASAFMMEKCKQDEELANQVSLRYLQIAYQLFEEIVKAGPKQSNRKVRRDLR